MNDTTLQEIAAGLAAPFFENDLRWKPRIVSGSRALALPYLTAAAIIQRLTEVLGADGWEDSYQVLSTGAVICQLRCRLGEAWITRQDVGIPSQQEAIKGSFSDALKRTARKYGIGLYLIHLGGQWLDYDVKAKRLTGKPKLPAWALPGGGDNPPSAKEINGQPATAHSFPENGVELERYLAKYDRELSGQGLFAAGKLMGHVMSVVSKGRFKPGSAPYGTDVRIWPARAIALAIETAKSFEARARADAVGKQ
jgi:hypothetical protein